MGRVDGLALVRRALDRCTEAIGFPQLALPDADPLLIHYVGPLGRERSIKVDVADDELVLETTDRSLILRYPDQPVESST